MWYMVSKRLPFLPKRSRYSAQVQFGPAKLWDLADSGSVEPNFENIIRPCVASQAWAVNFTNA